jgi:DNA-binding IclR family transcriptional regulator
MITKQDKENRYRVQALERALDILDCFTFQNRDLSLTEVVARTGLNKTTAKRLISNLTSRGYLHQESRSKRYKLGMRLFELGGIVFSSFSLGEAAASPMTRLEKNTGATVLLGTMMEDQLVYVGKREGTGMLRISSDIGWRRPLHYGMLGMTLMAFLDPENEKRILSEYPLEAHTPLSITDKTAFSLRLEEIRRQGYVVEQEEAVEGVTGIAAPIRDYSRQVIAALGIAFAGNTDHLEKGLDQCVAQVKGACEEISASLGYLKI